MSQVLLVKKYLCYTLNGWAASEVMVRGFNHHMKITDRANEKGAMGYILLWLIGIPIPVLFLIFLLRGCS